MTREPRPRSRDRHGVLGAWAVREVASYHLTRVAAAMADEGIPLMVLKGMWLQRYAYANPDERPFADLDLLVGRPELSRVEACLRGLGYRLELEGPGDVARLYVAPDGFQLDLHYDLFPDGLFRLRGADLLRRGQVDHELAGVSLLVPAPYDGFAHLVGHFAKGRHGPADVKLLRDFEELARAAQLDPALAAQHLVAGGLRRAALYALGLVQDPNSFARRTRAALPRDPVGERIIHALGSARAHDQPQRPRDLLFAFALDDSLGRGALACGRRTWELLRTGGPGRVLAPVLRSSRSVTPRPKEPPA